MKRAVKAASAEWSTGRRVALRRDGGAPAFVGGIRFAAACACLAGLLLSGCWSPPAEFRLNEVYVLKREMDNKEAFGRQRRQDVALVLAAQWGTPDDPAVPELSDVDVSSVLNIDLLRLAAGPVGRDEQGRERGLYRKHCAHCHGITGDGAGPTAIFLDPYPRDYRLGVFKFKSTTKGEKPTHEDLQRTLVEGLPDTAMPSFKLLAEPEIEALIHYVRYLSIRGEVERRLIDEAADVDEQEGERLINVALQDEDQARFERQLKNLRDRSADVIRDWQNAESAVTEIAPRQGGTPHGEALQASIDRGRELFYGAVANCVKCHGDSAQGDGQTTDWDDWTQDWTIKGSSSIDPKGERPKDARAIREFLAVGALPPRNIQPRNLREGVYRGGRRPIDLYWRFVNGIDGTPMPGAARKADDAPEGVEGLTTEDIWCLIDYVRHLPYEPMSHGGRAAVEFARERPN